MNELEPLVLEPSYDPYTLRIDIIRQKRSDYDPVMEQSMDVDVMYHPMGFDLGNGLFYDLNHNLSFRVNQLPGIDDPQDFKVKLIHRLQSADGIIHTIEPERYCVEKRNKVTCYDTPREGNKWKIFGKRKLEYAIEESPAQLTYSFRNRPKSDVEIIREEADHYYTDGLGKRRDFVKKDREVNLNGRYLIKSNDDGKRLEIYQIGKRVNKVLFAVEKSDKAYYIYDSKRRGRKIEYGGESLQVVRNNKVLTRIEILD
jgi:hypothetical protein